MNKRSFAVALSILVCATVASPSWPQGTVVQNPALDQHSPGFDIYCDFRCPFCARLFATLLAGAKIEGRTPSFRYQHFLFHDGAEPLALFYESALVSYPDAKDALIDSLYKFRAQTGSKNTDRALPALALLHGLDWAKLKRDMRARDVHQTVSESERSAVARDVHSTPTVFYGDTEVTMETPEELARFILDRSPPEAASAATEECTVCSRPASDK